MNFLEADLTGCSLSSGRVSKCIFKSTCLDEADLSETRFTKCTFSAGSSDLADFSGGCFEECLFQAMDLTKAILHGVKFHSSVFEKTNFGLTTEGEELVFHNCLFSCSDVSRLAPGGFSWEKCRFENMSFTGLKPRAFMAARAFFERCDLVDIEAPGARLEGAVFKDCLLSGASLQGANLREAKLERVDFQPGPSSRAGVTEETTRYHPMYGSQSGFYAQSLAEGVYGDPELVRTADLRGADLRGVKLIHTDLFRVDLRGALMDPSFRASAAKMQAFVDC